MSSRHVLQPTSHEAIGCTFSQHQEQANGGIHMMQLLCGLEGTDLYTCRRTGGELLGLKAVGLLGAWPQ